MDSTNPPHLGNWGRGKKMKSITMTADQTAAYDADDLDAIRTIRAEAQALANASGESVEVYTDDGITAFAHTPD
jgi:hypothetical protein